MLTSRCLLIASAYAIGPQNKWGDDIWPEGHFVLWNRVVFPKFGVEVEVVCTRATDLFLF